MNYDEGFKIAEAYKKRAEASQQKQIRFYQQLHQSIIGVSEDEIASTLSELEDRQLNALAKAEANSALDVWHGGSASVKFGLIYGNLDAKIGFSDGNWRFDANFWGFGVAGVTAGGGGPWGTGWTSPRGLKMGFEVLTASYGGGVLQVFWIYDKKVVGSFVGPAIGAAAIGGGGTGTWKKV